MVNIRSDGVLLTTVQAAVPFWAVPSIVNVWPGPATSSQTAWSGPAAATGFGFTVSTTSSVAVPQHGLEELMTVRRTVTVPTFVKVTVVSSAFGLPMVTPRSAELLLTTVQAGEPYWAVASMLNVWPGPGTSSHTVLSGPAAA